MYTQKLNDTHIHEFNELRVYTRDEFRVYTHDKIELYTRFVCQVYTRSAERGVYTVQVYDVYTYLPLVYTRIQYYIKTANTRTHCNS